MYRLLLALLLTGCGTMNHNACGPTAISKVTGIPKGEIRDQILSGDRTLVNVLGLFSREAHDITFPAEAVAVLESNGYEVVEVGGRNSTLKELIKVLALSEKGIALIQKRNTLSYHWITFPSTDYDYFESETVFHGIWICRYKTKSPQ
jgi:hypothetical protein